MLTEALPLVGTLQAGVALPVWTHNPKVVYDPAEGVWVMYHIGDGTTTRPVQNCTGSSGGPIGGPQAVRGQTSAAPFALHFSKNLNGPWEELPPSADATAHRERGRGVWARGEDAGPSLMTIYPGVSNVDAPGTLPPPSGAVVLYEQPSHGNGSVTIPFSAFQRAKTALAWDACGGATFDNGHPVEAANVGSRVGSFKVTSL